MDISINVIGKDYQEIVIEKGQDIMTESMTSRSEAIELAQLLTEAASTILYNVRYK